MRFSSLLPSTAPALIPADAQAPAPSLNDRPDWATLLRMLESQDIERRHSKDG
jgi:hypothetical protein